MEGEELRQGKARVRMHLTGHLAGRGMIRPRGRTVEDHDAMIASLEARLSYMRDDRLQALAEVVERHAGGKARNVWPAEVSICNWARRLQEPPASESRLVRSYLQSAPGAAAEAGGYLVELFLHLKDVCAPPGEYAWSTIRAEAQDNARKVEYIRREQSHGRASPSELSWLDHYMRLQERVADIRAAAGKGGDACAA
ncbi:MAG TPA: hypothetical protein DIT40_08960 [Alphaproteobacteria bacterium]|nr:hypothetical protein [Alphaproteobacteria bacterium]